MNNKKMMRFLLYAVPVLLLLSIWWNAFFPFLSLALVYLIILFFRNGWRNVIIGTQREPTVYYQPTTQMSQSEPPPRENPPLDFNLTAKEYEQLSKRYQDGYQPQAPAQSAQWPPFSGSTRPQPKQERPLDYDQPQAQYPEQQPPLQQY